ncbi:MAG: hypothetical protein H7Z16_04085 [Pyrinomonadaceae bacterium]|nr:hypothetical protein [Pyrinomonadaceae bacterium]
MKHPFIGLLVALAFSSISVSPPSMAGISEFQSRNSVFTLTPYDPKRVGYEVLPVRVIGTGGGRLAPNEKLEIFATWFANESSKPVKAVRFGYYVFKSDNRSDVIETGQTSLIPLLQPFEKRRVRIHVLDVDDIPSLGYKPSEQFHLEVAVTEAHYEDGTIWQATNLPGKLSSPKAP